VEKVVDVDPCLSLLKTSGRTGQKSLRNQNRRKKRMIYAAEVARKKITDPVVNEGNSPTETDGRDAL
jgi:hypothetical protein